MLVLVSLLTAAVYGSGDFLGAMATRRATIVQVVAGSHLVGLVGGALVAVAVADRLDRSDAVLGAAGGLLGAVGIGLLYRRLAAGPMSVVAPLTALVAAVVPSLWGVLGGERLSLPGWLGVVLALTSVVLVSSAPPGERSTPVTPIVVSESLASGCGFGGFFILLAETSADSQPWPVVSARVASTTVLLAVLVASRSPLVPRDRSAVALIAGAGVLDVAANIGFLYAVTIGSLAVAAVLTSFYPVATLLLARLVLGERMSRLQLVAVAGAVLATTLVTAA